jgi:hypothetical protein
LFIAAAVFFAAGVFIRVGLPAEANYGPGVFTFWALLLALGFTCTIGGVISWTLAGDPAPPAAESVATKPSPTYLPIEFPDTAPRPTPPEPARAGRGRSEFGRPAPEVRPVVGSGDFYEGPTDSERFEGPEYVLPIPMPSSDEPEPPAMRRTSHSSPPSYSAASPPSASARPEATEPVEEVLADLERIERDLAPRARSPAPTSP